MAASLPGTLRLPSKGLCFPKCPGQKRNPEQLKVPPHSPSQLLVEDVKAALRLKVPFPQHQPHLPGGWFETENLCLAQTH